MTYDFASATVLLLIIIDPLGNIPLLLNVMRPVAPARRRRVLVREVAIAFVILLGFLFFGEAFLRAMHLTDFSLQMAGGIVLFLIALRMVFPQQRAMEVEGDGEPLIVPLAVPALAGPSAMATVMLMASQGPQQMASWAAALAVAMLACLVVFLLADRIQRLLGRSVMQAFERLMGLVLVAVATDMVLRAIAAFVATVA